MVLKLGRDVAPYEIYHMVHILMLLWPFYSTLKSLLNERIFGVTYFSDHLQFN